MQITSPHFGVTAGTNDPGAMLRLLADFFTTAQADAREGNEAIAPRACYEL
jgi:hypothetical protein